MLILSPQVFCMRTLSDFPLQDDCLAGRSYQECDKSDCTFLVVRSTYPQHWSSSGTSGMTRATLSSKYCCTVSPRSAMCFPWWYCSFLQFSSTRPNLAGEQLHCHSQLLYWCFQCQQLRVQQQSPSPASSKERWMSSRQSVTCIWPGVTSYSNCICHSSSSAGGYLPIFLKKQTIGLWPNDTVKVSHQNSSVRAQAHAQQPAFLAHPIASSCCASVR